ncbi:hypothetical protein R1flu_017085 [Riccia fluitans]|uniref:Inner centromere protein ARK-binding domain-containing protein n=1 Tax=Riccia fluitans TaxID=41844 RepID=A0ABD1YPN4_9MARC
MDRTWLDVVLDSIEDHQNHLKHLLEQEKAVFILETKRLLEQHHVPSASGVAATELPAVVSTEPPAEGKRFSKRGYVADGTANNFGSPPIMQSNSKKVCNSRKRRKPLMDVSNLERASSSFHVSFMNGPEGLPPNLAPKPGNEPKEILDLGNFGCMGQSDAAKSSCVVVPPQTTFVEKSASSRPEVLPGRGKKRSGAVKADTLRSSAGGTESRLDAARSEGVSAKLEVLCPLAVSAPLRLTRSRAKNLNTGLEHLVEPAKKPKGKKNLKTGLEQQVAEDNELAKKPRGPKGRAKSPLPSPEERQVKEFHSTDGSVHLTGKCDGGETVLDGSDEKSGAAGDPKHESMMRLADSVSGRNPLPRRNGRKQKIVCKTRSSPNEESHTTAAVKVESPRETRSGCEAAEDGPAKHQIENPECSRIAVEQGKQQVNLSPRVKDIALGTCRKVRPVRRQACAIEGVVHTPPNVMITESREGDGGMGPEEAEVLSGRQLEEIAVLGCHRAAELSEEVVKKSSTKKDKSEVATKGGSSCEMEIGEPQLTGMNSWSESLKVCRSPGYEVAASVSHKDENSLVVGGRCRDVQVGLIGQSALTSKEEEVADQFVTARCCVAAEDSRYVTPQVHGKTQHEKGRVGPQQYGSDNLQQSRPIFELDVEMKRPEEGSQHEVSVDAIRAIVLSGKEGVSDSLGDVQPTEEETSRVPSLEAFDRRPRDVTEASFEAGHQDEQNVLWTDNDSQFLNILMSSVKVRKGRGRNVSSFLGYADSDLFPPRSLALGGDDSLHLAPGQEMKDVENAEEAGQCTNGGVGCIRPLADVFLKTGETVGSIQKEGEKELELDGRTVDSDEGRQFPDFIVDPILGKRCSSNHFRIPEGDIIDAPSVTPARKQVVSTPAVGVGLEKGMYIGSGTPFLTPTIISGERTPTLGSLEKSARYTVSGRGFPHGMRGPKQESNSNQLRKLSSQIVIELCPQDKARTVENIMLEDPCPPSGLITGRNLKDDQAQQAETSNREVLTAAWTKNHSGGMVPVNSKIRNALEDQGGHASCIRDKQLMDLGNDLIQRSTGDWIRSRKRPHSEFNEAKAHSDRKVGSVCKSLVGSEHRPLDKQQVVSAVGAERPSTFELSATRNDSSDNNKSALDISATRVHDSSFERPIPDPPVSSVMKFTNSGSQVAASGSFRAFRDVFSLKTPLRSQGRNVCEISADCQQMDPEASPPFHFPGAKRICRSGRVIDGVSRSHSGKSSGLFREQEGGVSCVQFSPAKSPPKGQTAGVGVSGTIETKGDDENGFRSSPHMEQCNSGRRDNPALNSLQNNGKVFSQVAAGSVYHGEPVDILGGSASTALIPSQRQDSLSRTKPLGSSGQSDKCELLGFSPCKARKRSLSLKLDFKDQSTPRMSLTYGGHTLEGNLELKDMETSSREKTSQHFKNVRRQSGTVMKPYDGTRCVPVMSPCGSSRSSKDFEGAKSTLHSPPCVEMQELRLSQAKVSGRNGGSSHVYSELADRVSEQPVAAAESFHEAEVDVISGSTMSIEENYEDSGDEDSGNTSILSEFRTSEGKQRRDTEILSVNSVENEFNSEENALDVAADSTEVQDSSDDEEVNSEEVGGPSMASERRDHHANEAEEHSLSHAVSYTPAADLSHAQKSFDKSFGNGTNAAGAMGVDYQASEAVEVAPDEDEVDTEDVGGPSVTSEQQDRHAHEPEEQSLSRVLSCRGETDLSRGQKSLDNSSGKRTKAAGTMGLDYQDSETGDVCRPSASYDRDCRYLSSAKEVARSGAEPKTVSNIINPFAQPSARASSLRTFIPVMPRPTPNFIPCGKRDVKVKALEAAEAAKRLQEKRDLQKRERMQIRAERIAKRIKEKEKPKEEMQKADQEIRVAPKSVPDRTSVKEPLPSTARTILVECTNTKTLHSPRTKLTRALAHKIKMEHKKKESEVLAHKRKKQEADKRDQERLRAELEEKEHRNRMREEAEQKRKAEEEEARRQRRAEREKERERRLKEDQEAKTARQAEKDVERKRKEEQDHRMAGSTDPGNRPSKLRKEIKGPSVDKLRASNQVLSGTSLGQSSSLPVKISQSVSTDSKNKGFYPELNIGPKSLATPTVVRKEPEESGPQTYEISPYRPSSDDEEDQPQRPKKQYAWWTSTGNVHKALKVMETQDPDEIFSAKQSSPPFEDFCLEKVFGTKGSMKVNDFSRRGESGDWTNDLNTWEEELQYKIAMGYIKPPN